MNESLETLRIELLGSPRIFINGRECDLPRVRVRALVFYLAATDKPVPRATLSWLLWPDCTQDAAMRNLNVHLSYLRSALPPNTVVSFRESVKLSPDTSTDIKDYNRLSSLDDEHQLAALNLFRGEFLEGFSIKGAHSFDQWLESQQTLWASQLSKASLKAAHILHDQDKSDQAIDILTLAIKKNPLNEELCRYAMTLMSETGEQGHVVKLYQGLVERLSIELGVPPSYETVACYQRIIGSNDAFTAEVNSSGSRFINPDENMPFIGRRKLLQTALSEDTRLVLVQGQSGMGKTRLLAELAKASDIDSLRVTITRQDKNIPFAVVAKILRAVAAMPAWHREASEIRASIPTKPWNVLLCLAPELDLSNHIDSSVFALSMAQVSEAFDTLMRLISAKQAIRLLIDDIHNADASSLSIFRDLIPFGVRSQVRCIATCNLALMGADAMEFLNALQKTERLYPLTLFKLDNTQMMELLLYFFPDIGSETAEHLIELADGNPYWMKTIMHGLDSGYTEFSGKTSLENLFSFTLRSLSPDALTTVEKLAVFEGPCEFRLFSLICRGVPDQILLELSMAGIVVLNQNNRVEFLHSKIQQYIVSRLAEEPHRLATAHLRAAQALEKLYSEGFSNAQSLSIVYHYQKSTHPELCARHAAKAGEYLLQMDNVETAIDYYKLAVRYLDGPDKLDATLVLYVSMSHRDQLYEANLYLQNAIELARTQDREDYALTFEAVGKLTAIQEFKEVQAGTIPCYCLDIDTEIRDKLIEAERRADEAHCGMLLMNYILGFRSSYCMIKGDIEEAKVCLNRIIARNLWQRNDTDSSVNILLQYSAIITLIAIMNKYPDEHIYSVIKLEEEIFRETPINSFSATAFGVKALLTNIHGNHDEGDRLMDAAIEEVRKSGNEVALANSLATQAMLTRKRSPGKSYASNREAYQLAQNCHARYSLVRSLIGLVVTSPDKQEAATFLKELREMASQIGDDTLYTKIAHAAASIDKR